MNWVITTNLKTYRSPYDEYDRPPNWPTNENDDPIVMRMDGPPEDGDDQTMIVDALGIVLRDGERILSLELAE